MDALRTVTAPRAVDLTPRLSKARRAAIMATLNEVAEAHEVAVADILGRSRRKKIAQARRDSYARLRDELMMTYAAIGSFMGRDHTTIVYGVRSLKAQNQLTGEVIDN